MKELTCVNLWFLSKSGGMLGQCLDSVRRDVLCYTLKTKKTILKLLFGVWIFFFSFSTSVCLNSDIHGHIFILRQARSSGELNG